MGTNYRFCVIEIRNWIIMNSIKKINEFENQTNHIKSQNNFNILEHICVYVFNVAGSLYRPQITDKSKVYLLDDLTDMKDENDHLALECGKETVLNYNIGEAGPGLYYLAYII